MENLGLDQVMTLHAVLDPGSPYAKPPPQQVFVDVDDATWRNPLWGGGEPDRAPRDRLFDLIDTAFSHDASQVVLDILVEGNNATRASEDDADKQFAQHLQTLLDSKKLGTSEHPEKQLVLVRSLRHPPMQPAIAGDKSHTITDEPYPALSELRESPWVDQVVSASQGRIAVAAPYFVYSPDRVLREWQLLKVVCARDVVGRGVLRVTPSVQLLVAARYLDVLPKMLPPQPETSCEPFRLQASYSPMPREDWLRRQDELETTALGAADSYWKSLSGSVRHATRTAKNPGRDFGAASFQEDDLSNRVVFRSRADDPTDQYFSRVPALLLLDGSIPPSGLDHIFRGRVVTIGQSYAEAGDQHYTPVGQIPGSVVLLNAIDSMVRYPMIRPVDWRVEKSISVFLIVVVAYIFAIWNSAIGPLISVVIALPLVLLISFFFFTYGIWFDLALPILAIFLHREIKMYEERRELKHLKQQAGNHHPH